MNGKRRAWQRRTGAVAAGRATALCVLASALSGAVPARAAPAADGPIFPPEKYGWIRADSANFVLFGNAPEARVLDLARRLEVFRAVLALVHKRLEVNAPVENLVLVFRDDASMTPYKKRYRGKPVEMMGFFVRSVDANFIVLNSGGQGDPLDTIYHEYTHYFLDNNLPRIPLWFNEGVAGCYETFKADAATARIGLPNEWHLYQLRQRALMPLRDLFAISHDSPDYNEGDRRGLFYSQSWALVHYLLWDKPERRAHLARFLDRLARGEEPVEAFGPSFETTPEKLEVELRQFVNQSRFHHTLLRFNDLKVSGDVRVTKIPRAEALARLGDFLARLARERAAEAEAHHREALRLDPRSARAHAGLGHLRLVEDRHDEAIAHLEEAVRLAPDDYLPHVLLGRAVLMRTWEDFRWTEDGEPPAGLQRARDLLGRAIQLRPTFAEAYAALGETYAGDPGNLAAGIRILQAAHQMLPRRTDIVVRLAEMQARNGDREGARRLVDEVLARMGDSAALRAARANLAADADAREAARREIYRLRQGPPSEDSGPPPLPPEALVFKPEYSDADYNGWVDEYNNAVALANAGNFKGAIAMLENLLSRIRSPQLAEQTRHFIEQLRKDGARLKKL